MAIDGTVNDDSLSGTSGDDVINGLDGDDSLYGGGGVDTLNGGNDNDYLDGGLGADTLNGGNGDDTMLADVGDTANGGNGVDLLYVDLSTVGSNITKAIDFTAGTVNNIGGTKFQNIEVLGLTTGSGNDTITYDSTAIYGSNAHASYWYGGNGNDHVIVDWSDQLLSITGSTGAISIASTSINFSAIESFDFYGGSGNDNFTGGAGVDKFLGNAGNDTLNGQGGNDTLDGGDGNDTIYAGNSTDNLGTDNIAGGAGDDAITAAYKDKIDGGQGNDYVILDVGDRNADATLAYNPLVSNTVQGTTFKNIEHLYLTTGSGDDSVSITSTAIQIISGTDDSWTAGSGNDTFTADMSDQIFAVNMNGGGVSIGDFFFSVGGVEQFIYTGGLGNDSVNGSTLDDVLNGNAGNDSMTAYGGDDTMNGGLGRDSMSGGDNNDTMDGGDDRDTLSGDAGADKITGGDGRDHLYGGTENDKLNGGDGNDIVEGDDGQDTIDGGAGNDRIDYVGVTNSTGKSYDTVANFDFASVDQFRFSGGVSGYDGIVNTGRLSNNTFNADLTSALGGLGAHHAILFQPSTGDHKTETFLVVDHNNVAGYQANEDYVVQLTTVAHLGSVDVTDFQG